MRISLTEVLEVNFVGGKLFIKYCIRSACNKREQGKDQIYLNVVRRNFDLGIRGEVF